ACSTSASPVRSARCGCRTPARRSAGARSCACRRAASWTHCRPPSCSATAPTRSPTPSASRSAPARASPQSGNCLAIRYKGHRAQGALPQSRFQEDSPMRALPSLTLLATALLAGCVSVNTQGDPARAGFGPPPNDSLNATVWYQTSVERDLIYAQTYRAAGRVLEQALADESWDALPRGERAAVTFEGVVHGLPRAIIVDVDETVLRSEEHTSELQSR